MLSYILLDIIVYYLKLLDFIVCYLTNYRALLYVISKIMGAIACYLTNYWTSLSQTTGHHCTFVISQTAGCHCLLPHKLLAVLFYLTNC
jgi:hypothetical protein